MKYPNVIREVLEDVLKKVVKPARYVDGELHAVKKKSGRNIYQSMPRLSGYL